MEINQLLDSAAQVFISKGFSGSSMEDIASAVNLNKVSLYQHISSKEEIFLALIERTLETISEHLQQISESPLSPEEKLRLAIQTYTDFAFNNPDLLTIILFEARRLSKKSFVKYQDKRNSFEEIWRQIIAEGVNKQVFTCSNIDLAVKMILSTLESPNNNPIDQGISQQQISSEIADVYLHGILQNRTTPNLNNLIFEDRSFDNAAHYLTPNYLSEHLVPYINAVINLENIKEELNKKPRSTVYIREISQNSPVSVSLEGAAEAVQVVKDTVIPWRRKHVETMARLLEQEKQIEIESRKAEILEKRANAAKGRAEAEKLSAETIKQREEAEKIKLENEKIRLELHSAKIQLGINLLNQISPNITESERVSYLVRLMPSLDVFLSSNLEIK